MPSARDSIGLPFTIFRARDAIDYAEAGVMEGAPLSEAAAEASVELMEAGIADGSQVKLLFARPGLSLTYVWFKSGYPLPRHSHDADCAYFIIAGSLRIGTEELGPGDGFFVGRDVPYTYTPGEHGVEVLEIRTSDKFDIKMLGNNPAFWAKALATVSEARPRWRHEPSPSGLSVG